MKKLFLSTSLSLNVISGFMGNGGTAILSMIFLPFYLFYIGAEGYGLVGIFASLQSILFLLDSGIGYTLNRELAGLLGKNGKECEMRDILKTVEYSYWCISIIVLLISLVASPFIAKFWVNPVNISEQNIRYSFYLLSIALFFQFPIGIYTGCLLGIQRHFSLNFVKIIFAFLKGVIIIGVLKFIDASITTFFLTNIFVILINLLILRWLAWKSMPKSDYKSSFKLDLLITKWKFAAGMLGIGIAAVILTQLDKVILSKILSLPQFGYYAIATTVGLIIYQLIVPISQSYFPKLTNLVTNNNYNELVKTYHQGCKIASVLIFPATFMLVFFSRELLFLWLRDETIVNNTWKIVSIYSIGTALNGLIHLPFMLTLAYNKSKIFFFGNLVMLFFMIPGFIISASYYGAIGGALCWAVTNIIYILVMPNIVHSIFLKKELFKFYFNDILKPLIASISVILFFRIFLQYNKMSFLLEIVSLCSIGFLSMIVAMISVQSKDLNISNYIRRVFRVS